MYGMELVDYALDKSVKVELETRELTEEKETKIKKLFSEFVKTIDEKLGE